MSKPLQWTPALSVRNAKLDEQHIMLIETARELVARLTSGNHKGPTVIDLLAHFTDSVKSHDELEEEILIKNDCPNLHEHIQTHRKTEAELEKWLKEVRSSVYDHVGLAAQLSDWLQHHLVELDMPVAGYMGNAA